MSSAAVVVLTYQRNGELAALLPELLAQAALVPDHIRIVIVDNDPERGARTVVEGLGAGVDELTYVSEPTPGIAAARNRALREVDEDLLVFIDDDETPAPGWLTALLDAHREHALAGVAGPVIRHYSGDVHPWVEAGVFRDRARYPTGTLRTVAATNNLLLDMAVVRRLGLEFDADFGLSGGSDTLFTSMLTSGSERLVWCDEAVVFDPVSLARSSRGWIIRRVFRLGNTWARVAVRTRRGPTPLVRARLLLDGFARMGAGLAMLLWGTLGADVGRRAHGVRLSARGAGMAAGAVGYVYVEYRRPATDSVP